MASDAYDPRDYIFEIYYDQADRLWLASASGVDLVWGEHPTDHLRALADLESKLSARARRVPTK